MADARGPFASDPAHHLIHGQIDVALKPAGSRPAASTHFCTSLSPEPAEIRRILLLVRSQFIPSTGEHTVARLELVLAEILNNIAEHGASRGAGTGEAARRVHLSAASAAGGIYCIVSDVGEAVPAECLAPRGLPRGSGVQRADLPEGGFGWFMIQNLVRKLYYGREGRRNILAFLIPEDHPVAA